MAAHRLLLVALLSGATLCAQSLVSLTVDPPVIVPASTTSVLVQAAVAGSPTRVTFESALQPGIEVDMRDDGTNGDRVAKDSVYTLTLQTGPIVNALRSDDVYRPLLGYIRPYIGTVSSGRYNIIAEVADPAIGIVPVARDAADVQHTDYLVNIVAPQAFPGPLVTTLPDQAIVTKRFFDLFPDVFDVLNIIYVPSYFQNRFHVQSRNAVRGIGLATSDRGLQFGSKSQLVGLSVFPLSNLFDGADTGVQHELGHQWINFLNVAPLASGVPHWPLSSMASGIMGFSIVGGEGGRFPCTLQAEGSNVRLVPDSNQPVFGDMDLYLMGLLPPDKVGEQIVLGNQDYNSIISLCNGSTYSGTFTRFHVSDLVTNPAIGPRVPDALSAQKKFRVGTIVVTPNSLLSPEAMSFYSFFAQRMELQTNTAIHQGLLKATGYPFAVSTRGLGSISARIGNTSAITAGGIVPVYSSSPVIQPGSWFSIYGSGLANGTALWDGDFPTSLGGVSVTVNGKPAYLWFVSPTQINAQAPDDSTSGSVDVVVKGPNGSLTSKVTLSSIAPSLNLFDDKHIAAVIPTPNGSGQYGGGTYDLVGPSSQFAFKTRPVSPGETLVLYGVGFGPTMSYAPAGKPYNGAAMTTNPVSLTIGGVPATVLFSGITGAGLYQINAVIPNVPSGDQVVRATVGGVQTPAGRVVTIR